MIINKLKILSRDLRYGGRFLLALRDVFKLKIQNSNVAKDFESVARKNLEKPCFYFENDVWTYKKVLDESNKIGNYFLDQGFVKGNVIPIFMRSRIEIIITWLGLSRIGVVSALVNFNLRSQLLQHSIEAVKPSGVILGYELSQELGEIYPQGNANFKIYGTGPGDRSILSNVIDIDPFLPQSSVKTPVPKTPVNFNDDLFYIYTSGTTGLPKAAIFKHSRFLAVGHGISQLINLKKSDVLYTPLPLQHTAGGVIFASFALNKGLPLVVRSKFKASEFWKDCIKHNVTVAQYIGELCRYLLRQPETPEEKSHKIRLIFGNGLRPELWNSFQSRFNIPIINEVYGATEGNCNMFNIFGHPGAIGFIPPLLSKIWPVKIIRIDENDEPIRDSKTGFCQIVDEGEKGELVGKISEVSPGREFKGYAGNEAESKKKILHNVFKKGDSFFRTGDVFTRDESGYYYFQDRIGDTFRWKCENVSTTQIEGVLYRLTNHHDVVVYGVKVKNTEGAAGMAAIADPNNEIDLEKLSKNIVKELPNYSRPLFLRIVKEIENTVTHKLKKVDLKRDGYDLEKIQNDKVYFFNGDTFEPLTKNLIDQINDGKIKL